MNLSSDKREGIEAGKYDVCMGSRSGDLDHRAISGLNMAEVTNMTLYDIHGKQIVKNISTLSNEIKLDENIDSGLYMLSIRYSNGEITNKKIVIVR